jgi:hypothetical protein
MADFINVMDDKSCSRKRGERSMGGTVRNRNERAPDEYNTSIYGTVSRPLKMKCFALTCVVRRSMRTPLNSNWVAFV